MARAEDVERFTVISPDGRRSVQVELPDSSIDPSEVGVIVNTNDSQSIAVADYFMTKHAIPVKNRIEVNFNSQNIELPFTDFLAIRSAILSKLTPDLQALALTFTKPYRFFDEGPSCSNGLCISATTAFAFLPASMRSSSGQYFGFYPKSFGKRSTKPFRDFGYRPTMMLAGWDTAHVKTVIDRSVESAATFPHGEAHLMLSPDKIRSALVINESAGMDLAQLLPKFSALASKWNRPDALSMTFHDGSTSDSSSWVVNQSNVLFYAVGSTYAYGFNGSTLIPGGLAYHPTSYGGRLLEESISKQMSILRWLDYGAAASFGTVREPFALPTKFPNTDDTIAAYFTGRTAVEALTRSVERQDEGLFVGDPLARPFGPAQLTLSNEGNLSIVTTGLLPGLRYSTEHAVSDGAPFTVVQPNITVDQPKLSSLTLSGISGGVVKLRETDVLPPIVLSNYNSSPLDDSKLHSLALMASDDDLIARGGIEVDGTPLPRDPSSDSLYFIFDPSKYANGLHSLLFWAEDRHGNRGSATGSVNVVDLTAPTLTILSPSDGATVSGVVKFNLSYSDNRGVTRFSISENGAVLTRSSTTTLVPELDTSSLTDGLHTLKVTAYDAAANRAERQITLTVNNKAPLPEETATSTATPVQSPTPNGPPPPPPVTPSATPTNPPTPTAPPQPTAYPQPTTQPSPTVTPPPYVPPMPTVATNSKDKRKPKIVSATISCNGATCAVSVIAEERGKIQSGLAGAQISGILTTRSCVAVPRIKCTSVKTSMEFPAPEVTSASPYTFPFPKPTSGRMRITVFVSDNAGNKGKKSLSLKIS